MAIDNLEWLGTWYQQQCNGAWEHQKGMLLEPMNPSAQSTAVTGWRLRIDLRGTADAATAPRRMAVCTMQGAWLRCSLASQRFEGEGLEVEELIGVFRQWIGGSVDAQPPLTRTASAG